MRSAYIYNFLIEANIMASIAIILMIPLRKFLRKELGNSALCFGWLLVAIRLLLPLSFVNPLIHEIRSPFAADEAIRPIAGQVKVRVTDAVDGLSRFFWRIENRPAYEAAERLSDDLYNANASILLAKIWFAGVLVVLLWYLFSNLRFRLRLRADRIEPISGALMQEYETLCSQRGVKPVRVFFTDPLPSACLVGVFHPYIALPLSASPQDAIHVLTHEVCHVRNRDHLWGLLRLLCCAIHWFNPLVWIAASMSRTDSELRCDDRVTQGMDAQSRKSYANVLFLAASRRNAPGLGILATGMTMTGRRLKTRISSVIEDHPPIRWLTVAFCVLSSMCLLGAFATSETREQISMGTSWYTERYMTEAIPQVRQIRSEEDALMYGRSLWDQVSTLQEAGQFEAFRNPDGSWYVSLTDSNQEYLFSASFLANGVVKELSQAVSDDRWLTEGEYIESMFIRPEEMARIRDWAGQKMDELNPGSSNLVGEFSLLYMRDTGDAQYLSLSAFPKDSIYDAGATMLCRMTDDGCELLSFSIVGNG